MFRKDGTFVKEWFYEKNTLGNGAVWDIAIWPDPKQTYLLSADGENNEIRVLKRDDGTVVGSFGRGGRNAGQFHWIHAMAIDAKGNVYTAEVDTGKRIQKFKHRTRYDRCIALAFGNDYRKFAGRFRKESRRTTISGGIP